MSIGLFCRFMLLGFVLDMNGLILSMVWCLLLMEILSFLFLIVELKS